MPTPGSSGSGSSLRARLRRALPGLEPGLEVIAEGLPARDGAIDLLARDAVGRLVIVLLAQSEAQHDGAVLLARGVATREWLVGELPGWLQLLPGLEVRSDTPVRCILFARDFDTTVRAAAAALPTGWIELAIYRPYVHAGDSFLLLEHGGAHPGHPAPSPEPVPMEPGRAPRPAEPEEHTPSCLRSGLSEADFALSRAERRSLSTASSPRPRYARDEAAPAERATRGN